MTAASALTALNTDVQNARTAITNKGGTVTSGGGSSQLATDIATIPSGGGGGYSELPSYEITNGIASRRTHTLTGNEFDNIIKIDTYGLIYCYSYCDISGDLIFNSLTEIGTQGCSQCFYGCYGITGVYYPLLQKIGISGLNQCFWGDEYITTARFTSLNILDSSALSYGFRGCTRIENIYFNALNTTSFGSYKNQFNNMMNGTGNTTTHTIHLPSNMQNTIKGLTGYPLFGGTSGYVVLAYDLPATS